MRIAARVVFIGWTVLVGALLFLGRGSWSIYHLLILLTPGWLVAALLWLLSRRR